MIPDWVRNIVERISRKVVLRRRLPIEFGSRDIFVSPDASLRFWFSDLGRMEPLLFKVVRKYIREGNIVWDIGANVGLFSLASAHVTGPSGTVIAMEPDFWLSGLLKRTADLPGNRALQIKILPLAVTGRIGFFTFNIAKRGRAANFIEGASGSSQTGGIRETQSVLGVSLDWLVDVAPMPDFVKIDVEGAEANVISGATRMLDEVRPLIMIEVSHNAEYVSNILTEHGYVLLDAESCDNIEPLSCAAFNTLAIPKEKMKSL